MGEDIMTGNTDDIFAELGQGSEEFRRQQREAMERERRERQSLWDGDYHTLALMFEDGGYPSPVITCHDKREDKPCRAKGLNTQECMVAFCATEVGWDAFELFVDGNPAPRKQVEMPVDFALRYYHTGYGEDYEDNFALDFPAHLVSHDRDAE